MLENACEESEVGADATYAAYYSATNDGHQKVEPIESILGFPSKDRITFRAIPGPVFELGCKGCYDYRNETEEASDKETSQEVLRAVTLDRPAKIL